MPETPIEDQGCRGLCGRRREKAALHFPWTCNLMNSRNLTGLRNHRGRSAVLCTCWENGDLGDVSAEGSALCSEAWTVKGMAVLSPEAALTQAWKDLELL